LVSRSRYKVTINCDETVVVYYQMMINALFFSVTHIHPWRVQNVMCLWWGQQEWTSW